MFVDEVRVWVASGKGGDGAVTFHREKYRPNGGPDGGNGGRGGSVVLVAEPGLASLSELKNHPHQKAGPGGNGQKNNRSGADADDLILRVPVGTVVTDDEGTLLADLASAGDRYVVAKGGRGGRGNASFKTESRRVPGFGELGEPGQELWVKLELRLIADVAVIGFPNAGKSTLVAALSAARPKIADYPFTTLEPTLGVVEWKDERFTICDIPGLVEGAHSGKGLGLKFLKHAERAPAFVHLIDLASGRDPLSDYQTVQGELRKFQAELAERPQIVALNKIDDVEPEQVEEAQERLRSLGIEVLGISAAERIGLDQLVKQIARQVLQARADRRQVGFELFRTPPDRVTVSPEGEAWRVEGAALRRWVAMTDLGNPEAVANLQNRLEKAGVEKELEQAGAKPGDEVRIGESVFEWWPAGHYPGESERPLRGKRG